MLRVEIGVDLEDKTAELLFIRIDPPGVRFPGERSRSDVQKRV
jgi:hypothetical protein